MDGPLRNASNRYLTKSFRSSRAHSSAPTVDEQKFFLKLFGVEVLDPDDGETHESGAKADLAAFVLEESSEEHLAWTSLVTICGTSAARQTGFTLEGLRCSLRADNLALKAVPSFDADIEALRRHTKNTLEHLAGLSRIQIGGQELKVDRLAVAELVRVAEQTSTLVVGQGCEPFTPMQTTQDSREVILDLVQSVLDS